MLIISSPDSEFITFLYDSLLQPHIRERIRFGSMVFRIESVSKIDLDIPPYGGSSSLITLITGTPITIRLRDVLSSSTEKSYHDDYYWRKEDPVGLFISQLQDNLLKKYQQFQSIIQQQDYDVENNEDNDSLFIDMSPSSTNDFMLSLTSFFQRLTFTLKKQIAIPLVIKQGNFNQVVIGTTWEFTLSHLIDMKKDTNIIRFILDCGLGERNSLGFGFMNIKTRK